MSDRPIPTPRDPWAALARHLTTADAWRRPAFVQPPPIPQPRDERDDDQEETQP